MAGLRPDDFDTGRIWIAFQVVAVVVVLFAGFGVGLALVQDVDVEGEERTVADCPPLAEAVGASGDPVCEADTQELARIAVVGAVIVVLGVALFVAAGGRRAWLQSERERLARLDELLTYRQDSMPWSYWVAVVVVGAFGLLNLAVLVLSLVKDWQTANLRGPVMWAALGYGAIWVYGRHRAYELQIDGDELVWRAPIRVKRYPLTALTSADIRVEGVVHERRGSLVVDGTGSLSVVVPNARHERRFRAFVAAIEARSPGFRGFTSDPSPAT